MLSPVKPLGGFSAYSPARFFETGGFLPASKNGQPPAGFKQAFCN
jgi:hypothetical protein